MAFVHDRALDLIWSSKLVMVIIEDNVVMMLQIPPSHEHDHRGGALAHERRGGTVGSLPPIKKVLIGDGWSSYGSDAR